MAIQATFGTLFIVGTPIGNLEDLTFRAVNTLKSVDLVAAEDTRRTRKLLTYLELAKPLKSYHTHNASRMIPELIENLVQGDSIALVTDGGMPCISDPGYRLIAESIEKNIPVTVIPGPSAVIAALAVSGLPADKFVFEGYLPKKQSERKKRWQELVTEKRAIVIYEAPHRMHLFLNEIRLHLPQRKISICREMTKIYEEVIRGTGAELAEKLLDDKGKCQIKGEITAVISLETVNKTPVNISDLDKALKSACKSEKTNRDAAKVVSEDLDLPFRKTYKRLLELINKGEI